MEVIYLFLLSSLQSILCYFWMLLSIFIVLTKYRIRKISDEVLISDISKDIILASSYDEDDKPKGIFISKTCCGIISADDYEGFRKLTCIISDANFKKYKDVKKQNSCFTEKEETYSLNYMRQNSTNIKNVNFMKYQIEIKKIDLNVNQTKALKLIVDLFNEKKCCVVYLYGKPGVGKTTLAMNLALKLNAIYVDEMKLDKPGYKLNQLYYNDKNSPFVIVINEVDIILNNVINNKITNYKFYQQEISNKRDWRQLLDKFDHRLFLKTILILTSNIEPEVFDKIDKSYLRPGRVNLRIKLE